MANRKDTSNIPELDTSQLGSHLFGLWNDPRYILFDNFHIERIEVYKDHLKMPIAPHRRSVFFFMYVTSGKVIRKKLLNEYEVLPNSLFCLAANVTNTIEYIAPETTGFYCHFHASLFQQLVPELDLLIDFPFFDLTANPIIEAPEQEKCLHSMKQLFDEYYRRDRKRFELIPLYLLTFLTEVKLFNKDQIKQQPIKDAAALLTMRYKRAISDFIYEKSKVFEFAEYLAVSPNHLNKCVKSVTGKSAQRLLSEMKIMEAKILLAQSDLSIGDIAFKIGNMGQSEFSRFFKTKTGLTPNQYRKFNT